MPIENNKNCHIFLNGGGEMGKLIWLNLSVEAAELETWDLNPATGKFVGNSRLKKWFGLPPAAEIPLTAAMDVILIHDRSRVSRAIRIALNHASGGNYYIEYTITNSTKHGDPERTGKRKSPLR